MVELKTHDDLSTYYLDKKIRETMAGIKINFYETMDREVPAKKQVSQQEDSWWTRFLNMLCGEHQNQDLLAD